MKIENNFDLYKYSTMRTHSIGDIVYFPYTIEDLGKAITKTDRKCLFVGGGSNIVFANRVEQPIVSLMDLNNNLVLNNDKTITAGCSVRIQKLINFGKDNGLGGFEYLYSLPASVGGIVYMNAGRGRKHHQQISDWLQSVEYLDLTDMKIKIMTINIKQWTYRHSPFHEMKAVIISATFKMKMESVEEVASKIKERIELVKTDQEGNKASCGSVFNRCNKYLMFLMRGKRIGGAHYSTKVNNWISNDKNGTGDDVISLIEYARKWHKRLGLECVPEIKIVK